MTEFIELINPDHLTEFSPDLVIAFFGICLMLDFIGALVEILFKGIAKK